MIIFSKLRISQHPPIIFKIQAPKSEGIKSGIDHIQNSKIFNYKISIMYMIDSRNNALVGVKMKKGKSIKKAKKYI